MISKKWIAYGTAGLIGLSVLGSTAAATAANMELKTGSGTTVPGAELNGRTSVLDVDKVKLQQISDSVVTVMSAGTAASVASVAAPGNVSVPSPNSAPSTPSPVSVPSPISAPSAPSPASPPSAASAPSVGSNG